MKTALLAAWFLVVGGLLTKAAAWKKFGDNTLLRVWFALFAAYQFSSVIVVAFCTWMSQSETETLLMCRMAHWAVAMVMFCLVWYGLERIGARLRRGGKLFIALCALTLVWTACEADCLHAIWAHVGERKVQAAAELRRRRLPEAFLSELVPVDASREYIRKRLYPVPPMADFPNPEVLVDKDFVTVNDAVFHSMMATYSLWSRTPVAVDLSGDMHYADQEDMNVKVNALLQRLSRLLSCRFVFVKKVNLPSIYIGDGNNCLLAKVEVDQNTSGNCDLHVRLHVELESLSRGESPAHTEGSDN